MIRKFIYAFIILQILSMAIQAQERGSDKLTLKSGQEISGRIVTDDINGISYHPITDISKTIILKTEDVIAIKFFDTPQSLINADNERDSGDVRKAITLYDTALVEIKKDRNKYRSLHQQYAIYGKISAYLKLDDYGNVISSSKQLLVEVPTTRFKKDVYMNWKECCSKAKSMSYFQDLLAELEKDQSDIAKNFIPYVKLAIADMEFDSKDFKSALKLYQEIEASTTNKEVIDKAQIGQLRCYEELKDTSTLGLFIETLAIKKDLTPVLVTVVFTYKGDIKFQEATTTAKKDKPDKTQYQDTLALYLKAISLGFPSPELESYSYYQRALFNAAMCYDTLANLTKKPETTEKYKKQARTLREELIRNYPKSELAGKAKEMMGEAKDAK